MNPPKTAQQVYDEGEVGRNLYRLSHKDFWVGEQKQRNYTLGSYKRFDNFGVPTPHDNEGNPTYKSLKWVTELLGEKAAPIVSKRVDEFRERTQPQLGKVHDPYVSFHGLCNDAYTVDEGSFIQRSVSEKMVVKSGWS